MDILRFYKTTLSDAVKALVITNQTLAGNILAASVFLRVEDFKGM